MLHDVGMTISYDDHHKHSRYLIVSAELPGFDPRERALIAQISRYHRKGAAKLGEMAELGDYSEDAHREVARAVEEIGVDVLIGVGPQARVYGGRSVADAAEAIHVLREELQPGDCVLVKGARVLELETVAEALAAVPY